MYIFLSDLRFHSSSDKWLCGKISITVNERILFEGLQTSYGFLIRQERSEWSVLSNLCSFEWMSQAHCWLYGWEAVQICGMHIISFSSSIFWNVRRRSIDQYQKFFGIGIMCWTVPWFGRVCSKFLGEGVYFAETGRMKVRSEVDVGLIDHSKDALNRYYLLFNVWKRLK